MEAINRKENLYGIALCVLVASIPLSVEINRVVTILFAVVTVLLTSKTQIVDGFKKSGFILLPGLLGLLVLFGMLYTTDLKIGLRHLERGVFMVVLPLMFILKRPDQKQINRAISFFIVVIIAVCAYCLVMSLRQVYLTGSWINTEKLTDRAYYLFINNELTQHASIAPIYLALFVTFSIAILLCRVFIVKRFSKFEVAGLVILHLFITLIFALSSFLALFAVWSLVVFYRTLSLTFRQRLLAALLYCALAGVLVAGAYSIKPLRERFASTTQFSFENAHVSYWNTVTMRLAVWQCATELARETPLLGFGTGDGDAMLLDKYKQKNFQLGLMMKLNAHNQYLQYYLMFGLLGPVAMLITVFLPLWVAFVRRNWEMFLFLSIVILGFLTESLLSVQKGVVFFSMFFPLLSLKMNPKNEG